MKLFWKSFGPISTMASLHDDNCAHLKFAGKGTGITVIPVSGPDDPEIKDLKDRNYPVRFAPCLKKKNESRMPTLKKLVREASGQDSVAGMLDELRTAAIDLAEEMRDFYDPSIPTQQQAGFVKDGNTLLKSIGEAHTKWSALKRKYNL